MPQIVAQELDGLVMGRNWAGLRDRLQNVPAAEITDVLLAADRHVRVLIFRSISRDRSAEAFSLLEPEQQDALLRELTDSETRQLLSSLSPDDRTELLEELPAPVTRRLMGLLSPADLKESRVLLGYPEESVGRLMTPDLVEVRSEWSVSRALTYIRENGRDSETINMIYAVDASGRLLDEIRLRRLILANPDSAITDLMDGSFTSLSAFDDREKAVAVMQRYDLSALPVVDSDGKLLGIVTFDDVMDVAEEEATEDMQRAASVTPLRMSYHRAGILDLFTKRVGWLVSLVLLNLASAGVIVLFEERIAHTMVLLFFVPILIGTGGNAGAQAAMLVIRALVTGDIEITQWLRIVARELAVAVALGLSLGLLGGMLGMLRGDYSFDVFLVVGLSMLAIVVIGNMVGTILPFLLARLKIDPAVASGPLITTIVDAAGLFVYFSIATAIIGW